MLALCGQVLTHQQGTVLLAHFGCMSAELAARLTAQEHGRHPPIVCCCLMRFGVYSLDNSSFGVPIVHVDIWGHMESFSLQYGCESIESWQAGPVNTQDSGRPKVNHLLHHCRGCNLSSQLRPATGPIQPVPYRYLHLAPAARCQHADDLHDAY